MKITVKFFASYRDKTGQSQIQLSLEQAMTIRELKTHLVGLFPALNPLFQNTVASINLNFAQDDDRVEENAEVAFFPPVSGGSGEKEINKYE